MERGILAGTGIQEAQYARYDTGRLHSYFGVFPPWDARNISTKQRVSGRGNLAMPLVVLHVPVLDLVRLQGRVTDSGNIIVSRPVPFSLVKEVWFCIPKDTDRKGFDHIEKIMDGDLEDEMALEYQASPILHDFKKMKTPARLMQLLCDMPSGPHNAEKERLLRELAATIDYHHEDARRQHYLKEAANFMIKRTHPGDLVMDSVGNQVRMRLCPACYHLTPSCFSRCSICWSLFVSRGKFRRQEPTRAESPTEVPNANIAHSMEAAAAAVPEVGPEEDDRLDAMTVAEPEMEVDVQESDPEPENADDLPDLDEYPEEVNDNSDDTRQAVLLSPWFWTQSSRSRGLRCNLPSTSTPALEIASMPTVQLSLMLPTSSVEPSTKCCPVLSSGLPCLLTRWSNASEPGDVTMRWELGQDLYPKLIPKPTSAGTSQMRRFGTVMLLQVASWRTRTSAG